LLFPNLDWNYITDEVCSAYMMTTHLRVGFVRNVIQEAIQAIEAEIEERQGLNSKLRKLSVRPVAVDRADGIARPKWSAARRKRVNATWAKKKAAKAKGA
jgi:alkylhydroperoxidase family enzyme